MRERVAIILLTILRSASLAKTAAKLQRQLNLFRATHPGQDIAQFCQLNGVSCKPASNFCGSCSYFGWDQKTHTILAQAWLFVGDAKCH